MTDLEDFKSFVRKNPSFANYIKDGTMTWQKFYELYDMYGEDNIVWKNYKLVPKKDTTTLTDIFNMAKNIDMDKLQDGVNSLSKAVDLFSSIFLKKDNEENNQYKPRPIYKRFED